jgi:hypothetical protein
MQKQKVGALVSIEIKIESGLDSDSLAISSAFDSSGHKPNGL